MSRVDHWASVRDRTFAARPLEVVTKPKPKAPPPPPTPEILELQRVIAQKEKQIEDICAEIEALGKFDGPFAARKILQSVARAHGLTTTEMLSHRRHKHVVRARQHAMWEIKRNTKLSLFGIGKVLGGMDHTTILHGIRQHEKRLRESA